MFKRICEPDSTIRLTFEGREIAAAPGDTVAAALLANGVSIFRETAISGSPRGPFCMIGACFECLVTIDGRQNRQACLIPVQEGMEIMTQRGARRVYHEDN